MEQAKERLFLSDARRRILEDYQAESGGLHLYEGKLYLIRHRFEIGVRDLDKLYEDLARLVRALRENP